MDGVYLKATEPLREILVLFWSTLKGWKAASTLEPPIGFEHDTPRLEIQRLNH